MCFVIIEKQFTSTDYSFIKLVSENDDYTFGYYNKDVYVLFSYGGKPKIVGRRTGINAIKFIEMFLKTDFISDEDKLDVKNFLERYKYEI